MEAAFEACLYTRISLVIDTNGAQPRLRLTDTRVAQYVLLAAAARPLCTRAHTPFRFPLRVSGLRVLD